MRVLLGCSLGGIGHLLPLTTVGRQIQRAGHEVLVLVPPALAASAEREGLTYRVGDEPPRSFVDEIWRRVREGPADAVAGLIDRELFADRCTEAMLPSARAARDAWKPDLVVREPCEYATAVVAHDADIPQAQVGISLAAIEYDVRAMVAPIIDRFSPGVSAAIAAAPYLSWFPPSLDPSPWPKTHRYRLPRPASEPAGEWLQDHLPLIYMTFGTVLGHLPEAIASFRAAIDAVAGLPARVLLTVGRATDVSELGPVPENVRVAQWVPQDVALARATLVVCHGGSGTTYRALSAGVPLVICPLFADQARNGRKVEEAGAGAVVAGDGAPAGGLRSLRSEDGPILRRRIEEVLGNPSYRDAARSIAAEMATAPSLEDLIARII